MNTVQSFRTSWLHPTVGAMTFAVGVEGFLQIFMSRTQFDVVRDPKTSSRLVTFTKLAVKYRAAKRYNDLVPSAIFS